MTCSECSAPEGATTETTLRPQRKAPLRYHLVPALKHSWLDADGQRYGSWHFTERTDVGPFPSGED